VVTRLKKIEKKSTGKSWEEKSRIERSRFEEAPNLTKTSAHVLPF
jgi:hypothetical protein